MASVSTDEDVVNIALARIGAQEISDLDNDTTTEAVEARRVYRRQFADRGNVRASKRLVRQTRHWGHGNTFDDPVLGTRNTAPFYEFVQSNLGPLWGDAIGVRAVVGRWDPTAKDEVLAQWTDALPQLEGNVQTFPDRGHFIEEQEPDAVAAAIADVSRLA